MFFLHPLEVLVHQERKTRIYANLTVYLKMVKAISWITPNHWHGKTQEKQGIRRQADRLNYSFTILIFAKPLGVMVFSTASSVVSKDFYFVESLKTWGRNDT